MKKWIILVLLAAALAVAPVMAADNGAGKTKVGTILGRGLFVTAGFPMGKTTELNVYVGTSWNFYSVTVGANFLFKLVDINIEGETFPLSLGPQVDVSFGYYGGGVVLGVFADLRWEYTFNFPLNLFIEIGPGIDIAMYNGGSAMGFGWRGGLGVRYVF